MATARANFYCHKCQLNIEPLTNYRCPHCHDSFIEEILTDPQRIDQRRQIHSENPHSNVSFTVNRNSTGVHSNGNDPFANFLQNLLIQLTQRTNSSPSPMFLPTIPRSSGASDGRGGSNIVGLDVFLNQFLSSMGENGPAPASEMQINSITNVKITGEQVRENIQCSICMDDFQENDQAKCLPCLHYFHEQCIAPWLRLHGTCPTCRISLTNSSNGRNHRGSNSSSNNPSMRRSRDWNDRGGNDGSSSASNFSPFEFD